MLVCETEKLSQLNFIFSVFLQDVTSSTPGSAHFFPLLWLALNRLTLSGLGHSVGSEAQVKWHRCWYRAWALWCSRWVCLSFFSLLTVTLWAWWKKKPETYYLSTGLAKHSVCHIGLYSRLTLLLGWAFLEAHLNLNKYIRDARNVKELWLTDAI